METRAYIESGILELYVYGLLSESESAEVAKIAAEQREVNEEIVSIEKAILGLSTGFSPYLPAENFERIKEKIGLKYQIADPEIPSQRNWPAYLGWAAAILLMAGTGFLYMKLNDSQKEITDAENEKAKVQENALQIESKNTQTENLLTILRDTTNTVVALSGQTTWPKASAKIYWNKQTQAVYIDASGLADPPQGQVYQVWALTLKPMTPTSIGMLENFTDNTRRIFNVINPIDAQAFGITLEPEGGSPTPTMDQLCVMGKI